MKDTDNMEVRENKEVGEDKKEVILIILYNNMV